MNKIEIYKELVRYGSIMRDFETESDEGYRRTTIYSYQGMEFTVTMLNGEVVTVDNLAGYTERKEDNIVNKQRRKRLREAVELIECAVAIVEEIKYEEKEALENLPTNLQEGEGADNMQECVDALEEIWDDLKDRVIELGEL